MVKVILAALVLLACAGCTVTGSVYWEKDCGQYGVVGSRTDWRCDR